MHHTALIPLLLRPVGSVQGFVRMGQIGWGLGGMLCTVVLAMCRQTHASGIVSIASSSPGDSVWLWLERGQTGSAAGAQLGAVCIGGVGLPNGRPLLPDV